MKHYERPHLNLTDDNQLCSLTLVVIVEDVSMQPGGETPDNKCTGIMCILLLLPYGNENAKPTNTREEMLHLLRMNAAVGMWSRVVRGLMKFLSSSRQLACRPPHGSPRNCLHILTTSPLRGFAHHCHH